MMVLIWVLLVVWVAWVLESLLKRLQKNARVYPAGIESMRKNKRKAAP